MGFWSRHDSIEQTPSGINIESVREDRPAFKRLYTKRLDSFTSIKIDMHTFLGTRFKSGELTQPNGRWILFNPDAVADKILDPALVPLVQEFVDQVNALDRTFISSDPDEFTDVRGCKWKRI